MTGLPVELRAQILERSEGIPFYAVETVRMLIDRGLLARRAAPMSQRHRSRPSTCHPPSQALIAARLDHLSAEERRVLQDAIGSRTDLHRVRPPGSIGPRRGRAAGILDLLVRKEILSLADRPAVPPSAASSASSRTSSVGWRTT